MTPLYLKVKEYILDRVRSGEWKANDRIPSENEFVQLMKVSRMTVNRALRELAKEGILSRTAGLGTFVADVTGRAHPLAVRNIADEIRERGHVHSARVVTLEEVHAVNELARSFGIMTRAKLFRTVIVHYENGQPVQVEDRQVNPAVAPDYLSVDFSKVTPYEYLIHVAPLQEAEHVVRAIMPRPSIRTLLEMKVDEPCLLLQRKTWSKGIVASNAQLFYPGTRYELTGRFKP